MVDLWSCSNFSDVFDEEHFIQSLASDVRIVKKLPKELATTTKAVKYFTSWSGVEYYQDEISRLWDDYQVWCLCHFGELFAPFFFLPTSLVMFGIVPHGS